METFDKLGGQGNSERGKKEEKCANLTRIRASFGVVWRDVVRMTAEHGLAVLEYWSSSFRGGV
jgi:UDP-N-acetylenolpyruvoylglucosamine reductase